LPPPPECKRPILVEGLQGLTERQAEERAREEFAARVRAAWGERYSDLRFARNYYKRCYRSSVGDNLAKSIRERIKERVGVISDGSDANDAMEYRCDVFAQPCQAGWMEKGADVKKPDLPPQPGYTQ